MSKVLAMMVAIVALVSGAIAYYWLRGPGPVSRLSRTAQPVAASSTQKMADRSSELPSPSALEKKPESPDRNDSSSVTPLRPGEVLEFAADVANLSNVADLRLQIVDRGNFFGRNAWHLQAFARTENPLRMVFELDDQFDSYSDAATLSSLQYEMHLNERGQKQESIQRMSTTDAGHATSNASETRVAPGTRDPLGLMQYLRTVDWAKTREVRSPVYDGHKLYDVSAKFVGAEQNIAVPAGNFAASKIEIRVFDAGAEMKDAHFALYLAGNASRTPVLLEAVMPFATARVALVKTK